ncbi:pentatricopeptide repeat-containing protein, partial [Tanacetum coccineum]
LSSAQKLIHHLVSQSPTLTDQISVVNFARNKRLELALATYSTHIIKLVNAGEYELAEDENGHFQKLAVFKSLSSGRAFSEIIAEVFTQDRLVNAYEYCVKVKDVGIRLGVSCYNKLIGGLSLKGYVDEARHMFNMMLERSVAPVAHLFKSLVFGFCKMGIVDKEFSKGHELHLTLKILNVIAKHEGFGEHATALIGLMEGMDRAPDSTTFLIMVNEHCKWADLAVWEKRRVSDAQRLLKKMLESGVYPDEALYPSMEYSQIRVLTLRLLVDWKGELEFVFRLVSLMGRSHIECDHITYITLISGICRNVQCYNGVWHDSHSKSQKDREDLYHLLNQNSPLPKENDMRISLTTHKDLKLLAIKLIRGINGTSYMPNLYFYNGILTGFCRMGKFEEAYDQMDVMEEQGVGPNQVSFTICRFHDHSYKPLTMICRIKRLN